MSEPTIRFKNVSPISNISKDYLMQHMNLTRATP
jgi:hypothetical protein